MSLSFLLRLLNAFCGRFVAFFDDEGDKLKEEDLEVSGKGFRVVGVHLYNGGQVIVNALVLGIVGDLVLELSEEKVSHIGG